MREIDLHDDFWPGALDALTTGAPAEALRERWPNLSSVLEELAADAEREPLLVGLRLATPCRNSRLFAILAGACLARAGLRTIVLDLSSDTRWLEQLLGADFKEGLVDHLRFGVPLERCVRTTALDRFAVLSAGAAYLVGSPLDDAPGLRSALERLRQRHRVVLVTLPPPLEAGDGAGLGALCGALIAVEEQGAAAPLLGSERAVVRLAGDPEAARDIARLTYRFLGPLSSVVAGLVHLRQAQALAPPSPLREAAPATQPAFPELALSEPVEAGSSGTEPAPAPLEPAVIVGPARAPGKVTVRRHAPARSAPPSRPRRRGWRGAAAALALVALAAAAFAGRDAAADVLARIRGGGDEHAAAAPAVPSSGAMTFEQGASVAALPEAEPPVAEDMPAMPSAPRRTPYSVHVGSYQRVESAMAVVEQVEQAGLTAYVAPVSIPGKGSWQRVYVGAFGDSVAARGALARLQQAGAVQEGLVKPTPWAFELGFYATPEEARAEAEILRRAGIVAYVSGGSPVRLYAGAYGTREEADLLARMLDAALDGRAVTLMLREE